MAVRRVYGGDMNHNPLTTKDSRTVTEAQNSLGKMLAERTTERTVRHGVEIPVTFSGRY